MDKLALDRYDILIDHPIKELFAFIPHLEASRVGVLVDENTRQHCWPLLQGAETKNWQLIEIPAGERHKNLETCRHIWQQLMNHRFDRHSLLINLGGGVIGDMGGFCAATFKRGIQFIHVPTTLLSQVDASIGGKLGIDFDGIKNSIGLFGDPELVFIQTDFLKTLPQRELRSGFAEVIKHAVIGDADLWADLQEVDQPERAPWGQLLPRALSVKQKVVKADPFERGLRQVLNFGHTIGHALESWFLETDSPALHGEAIAAGMICESHLAVSLAGLPKEKALEITAYIDSHYSRLIFPEEVIPELMQLMRQDKKNQGDQIRFALPAAIGQAEFNLEAGTAAIEASLRMYLAGR